VSTDIPKEINRILPERKTQHYGNASGRCVGDARPPKGKNQYSAAAAACLRDHRTTKPVTDPVPVASQLTMSAHVGSLL